MDRWFLENPATTQLSMVKILHDLLGENNQLTKCVENKTVHS